MCRNEELKYEAQMYNWYPIFSALSKDKDFRDELNTQCYDTIRLLEQGYYWYPMSPLSNTDQLGMALNGDLGFKVDSTEDWWNTKDEWVFDMHRSEIQKHPVEIRGLMSEDLDLFYSVQEMIDVFDFKLDNYNELCHTISLILRGKGDELTLEGYITDSHMFNYLTEEPRPRDILYYICALDDSMPEEEREAFFQARLDFHKLFN